jgi:hypothetical protein
MLSAIFLTLTRKNIVWGWNAFKEFTLECLWWRISDIKFRVNILWSLKAKIEGFLKFKFSENFLRLEKIYKIDIAVSSSQSLKFFPIKTYFSNLNFSTQTFLLFSQKLPQLPRKLFSFDKFSFNFCLLNPSKVIQLFFYPPHLKIVWFKDFREQT